MNTVTGEMIKLGDTVAYFKNDGVLLCRVVGIGPGDKLHLDSGRGTRMEDVPRYPRSEHDFYSNLHGWDYDWSWCHDPKRLGLPPDAEERTKQAHDRIRKIIEVARAAVDAQLDYLAHTY